MSYSYSQMNQNNQQLYRYPLPPYPVPQYVIQRQPAQPMYVQQPINLSGGTGQQIGNTQYRTRKPYVVYPQPAQPIPATVLCTCAAFCDCYDESPEELMCFDPIELKYREKSIQHAKRCFDMPSILNMISKFDHTAAWMVLNTLIRQKCAEPRKIYYKVAPITEIFSDDILQYIVSFNEQYEVHCINKSFKQFAFKNETIRMRHWIQTKTGDEAAITKIYQSKMQYAALHQHSHKIRKKINTVTKLKENLENRESSLEYKIRRISKKLKTFFQSQPSIIKDQDINHLFPTESCIKYNPEVNDVWFIDTSWYDSDDEEDKRPELPVSKYRGPFENLNEVLEKCQNGDTIYIKGTFRFAANYPMERNVKMIGIEECIFSRPLACFESYSSSDPALCITNGNTMHFQNIQFQCGETDAGFLKVGGNAKLFLSNCQLEVGRLGIRCDEEKASVYAQKCLFTGTDNKTGATAIAATAYSKDVFITNCAFVHCGNPAKVKNIYGKFPCIKISDRYSLSDYGGGPPITINFEAAGNSFENNYGSTIGVHCTCNKGCCLKDERFKIHDNTLKGFNGLHISDKAKDAN